MNVEIDDSSEYDIFKLTKEELEKVPFDVARWQCKVKLCTCFTRVRDYGLDGVYYWKQKKGWIDIRDEFFMCSKHYPRYKGKALEDIPLKRSKAGGVIQGGDDTGKEFIIY